MPTVPIKNPLSRIAHAARPAAALPLPLRMVLASKPSAVQNERLRLRVPTLSANGKNQDMDMHHALLTDVIAMHASYHAAHPMAGTLCPWPGWHIEVLLHVEGQAIEQDDTRNRSLSVQYIKWKYHWHPLHDMT